MNVGGQLLSSPSPGTWGQVTPGVLAAQWQQCPFYASPKRVQKAGGDTRGKAAAQDRARASLLRKELGCLAELRADKELSIQKAR